MQITQKTSKNFTVFALKSFNCFPTSIIGRREEEHLKIAKRIAKRIAKKTTGYPRMRIISSNA